MRNKSRPMPNLHQPPTPPPACCLNHCFIGRNVDTITCERHYRRYILRNIYKINITHTHVRGHRYSVFITQTYADNNLIIFTTVVVVDKLNNELIDSNYCCIINRGWIIIIIYSLNKTPTGIENVCKYTEVKKIIMRTCASITPEVRSVFISLAFFTTRRRSKYLNDKLEHHSNYKCLKFINY